MITVSALLALAGLYERYGLYEEAQALLQACYTQYSLKLQDIARASLDEYLRG